MDSPNKIPMTPGSTKIVKKQLDMKKFRSIISTDKEKFDTYVIGISGGDCAGKK